MERLQPQRRSHGQSAALDLVIAPTPNRVAVQERAVLTDGAFEPVASTEVFYGQAGAPVGGKGGDSPRSRSEVWLRMPHDVVATPPEPGSILVIDGVDHEVSDVASPLRQGTRPVGWEIRVVALTDAYPTSVSVVGADGDVAEEEAAIAMWSPKDSTDDRGEREEKEGEAPYGLYSLLVARNAVVNVGSQKWRVVSCVLEQDVARVSLRLRNTRGGE